jgi:hypothetical protein
LIDCFGLDVDDDDALLPGEIPSLTNISAMFEDVDKTCRQETQDLYNSEGLSHMLSKDTGGVPASLQEWLTESRHKVLGRDGYRERAWKRLWAQSARLDAILIRFRNLSDQGKEEYLAATMNPESDSSRAETKAVVSNLTANKSLALYDSPSAEKMSIQGAILRYFLFSALMLTKRDSSEQRRAFSKLLSVWAHSRELNERQLRPRLGSPDKRNELMELDAIELKRSQEMTTAVQQFRSTLIRHQVEKFRFFVEDVAQMSKGLLLLLDNSLRQELLQVPPDTEIPKKHMTLKKLRKAQRIREEVARGGQDNSQKRVWPGVVFSAISLNIVRNAEDMIIDLGKDPKDFTGSVTEASPVATAPDPKDKKAAAKDKKPADKKGAEIKEESVKPSVLPDVWLQKIKDGSSVECLVSSAHRIVLEERSAVIDKYLKFLDDYLSDVREEYTTILTQEHSWNERWKRQVDMLKS